MKKMMIVAALIGAMLMPAEIMAQNNRKDAKARVENRGERRDNRVAAGKGRNEKPGFGFDKPGKDNRPGKNFDKPGKPGKGYGKPYKPAPVVVVNRPAPRPCPPPPPPPPVRVYECDNDVVGAAVAVVGLAALVSLIAD